jgi:hypothetical protein
MTARSLLALAAPLLFSAVAHAATNVQPLTPVRQSVAGGESQVFSLRFTDAQGRPAVGENVTFSNDACGFFPNGGLAITVRTDSNGVASTTFTARYQGIVGFVTARAGVAYTYTLLTYIPSNVGFDVHTDPPELKPGQSFTLTASPQQGVYPIYNHDISARVVAGSTSASIAPGTGNTGQAGAVTFGVVPDNRLGDYQVDLQFRNHVQRFTPRMSATPWQDMWWSGPAEDGWGMSAIQHRDVLFSVIYAYDPAGNPVWYVMPGGSWNEEKTAFSGALYLPRGAPYSAYDPSKFVVGEAVGHASLAFTDPTKVVLDYTIAGVTGRKTVSRQPFGRVDSPAPQTVGDMWWGGPEQNGWGIAVLQQYQTLFSVWFTYDGNGEPTWFVMPGGFWSDSSTYQGRLYRASGSPWLGRAYDPAQFKTIDVGSFKMRFAGDNGTFDYVIEGRSGSMPLQRQPF